MNSHARRLHQTLIALGFECGDPTRDGKRVYRHPNSPEQCIKLWPGMAEGAARAAADKARQLAGLSVVGTPTTGTIREQVRIKQATEQAKRAAEARRRERGRIPYQLAADERAAKRAQFEAEQHRLNELREMRALMMPGGGR